MDINRIETGVCPICESMNIDYGNSDYIDDGVKYECVCENCGTTWSEIFELQFAGIVVDDEYYAK